MPPSPQGFAGREIVAIVALLLGVLAALAYSAVQKTRQRSQDSTVLCNIRQLSAAADQYYLENGVSSARLTELVGPTNYLRALGVVDRETYPAVFIRGLTITVGGVGGARTVTYAP